MPPARSSSAGAPGAKKPKKELQKQDTNTIVGKMIETKTLSWVDEKDQARPSFVCFLCLHHSAIGSSSRGPPDSISKLNLFFPKHAQKHKACHKSLTRLVRTCGYNRTQAMSIVSQLMRKEREPLNDDEKTIQISFTKLGAVVLQLLSGGQCHGQYVTVKEAAPPTPPQWKSIHV